MSVCREVMLSFLYVVLFFFAEVMICDFSKFIMHLADWAHCMIISRAFFRSSRLEVTISMSSM